MSYMFPCELHRPQGELRITRSKVFVFHRVVTLVVLQNIKYIIRNLRLFTYIIYVQ